MKKLFCAILITGFISAGVFAQPELDTTFNSTGIQTVSFGINASGAKVAVQPDNKIVLAGSCVPSSSQQCVARYNEDGSLDTTFGQQGFLVNFGISSSLTAALQSDGKIVAGSTKRVDNFPTYTINIALARYTADGSLDSSFGGGNVFITGVGMGLASPQAMVIQSDGKIVIVGTSTSWSTFPTTGDMGWVIRYLPDGTPDTSFGNNGLRNIGGIQPFNQSACTSVAIQPDGKLLLGIRKTTGTGPYMLQRWNADGSPDPTWGGGDGIVDLPAGNSMSNVRVMPDGRIVGIINSKSIYRFNPDGSLDTSFDGDGSRPLTGLTSTPYDLAVSASGKLTMVGPQPNGSATRISIYKLKADGSVETGFGDNGLLSISNPLDPASDIVSTSCAFDSQGRLVVGGRAIATPNRFIALRLVAPPVMPVSVSGRVTDVNGNGVANATVSTQGSSAQTSPFGYYTLNNVQTNRTYIFSVRARNGAAFNKRTILVDDNLTGIDFVGVQIDSRMIQTEEPAPKLAGPSIKKLR
jgi:uncharacterized delta-60 repeat protein